MNSKYGKKWFMFDLARQRSFVREEAEVLLDTLHRCGYNGIGLYIEGFFEFPEFGGAPREGCMTADDAKWITEIAKKYEIEVIPMTNLVGHGESFLSQERYGYLAKYCDKFQFDMKSEGFREFAKSVIDQLIDCFKPKFMHIGGDEVRLSDKEKRDYASFLSDMCSYLGEKGIQTGIWGDMLYKHPEIAEIMSKDIWVFDWWYYGHRSETPKMLREMGFKKIVVCPGTQSWNGIVATQLVCPWKNDVPWKAIDIKPGEVEAFLIDSQPYDVYDTMLTDWENYQGHLMWNNMHIVARFGRFVNGKGISDDELSECLFGRKTPFMDCMHELMNAQSKYYDELEKLPGRIVTHSHGIDAAFSLETLSKILQCGERMSEETADMFKKTGEKVSAILACWKTVSPFEDRCKRHLQFAVSYVKVNVGILNLAHKTKALYREAAFRQFDDTEKYSSLLCEVQKDFREFAAELPAFRVSLEKAIKDSGHTKKDLERIDKTKEHLEEVALRLNRFTVTGSEYKKNIALLSWQNLICDSIASINVND